MAGAALKQPVLLTAVANAGRALMVLCIAGLVACAGHKTTPHSESMVVAAPPPAAVDVVLVATEPAAAPVPVPDPPGAAAPLSTAHAQASTSGASAAPLNPAAPAASSNPPKPATIPASSQGAAILPVPTTTPAADDDDIAPSTAASTVMPSGADMASGAARPVAEDTSPEPRKVAAGSGVSGFANTGTDPQPASAAPALTAAEVTIPPAVATLNLTELETRLRKTKAIGLFTKLEIKNQVEALLEDFDRFHAPASDLELPQLEDRYDLLMMKLLLLLQDDDPGLHRDIADARGALWHTLVDPIEYASMRGP